MMPRHKLANVSLAALQAEIERRKGKLADMIAERDALNKQIAELEGLADDAPAPKARKKPGPKPGKKAKAAAAAPAKKARGPGSFGQSAEEMILDLLKGGKTLSTTDIAAAWVKAGRKGNPSKTLGGLAKAGKVKREVIKGSRSNNYRLA
jgi:hypothetical protein